MWVSEQILYRLARLFYRSEAAHSGEMKKALADRDEFNKYRLGQIDLVLAAAREYGIDIAGKSVLDMGCNDGALTEGYLKRGAREVVGVDIDREAIERAQQRAAPGQLSFEVCGLTSLPLADDRFDVVLCYDVFEHVAQPAAMLEECYRVLAPGGKMLIGTWGWYHPFAPHLWSTMPVPWAHVFFSERTVLRTCRRVYQSPWYVPNMHDFDKNGQRIAGKYLHEAIPTDYLNKFLIRDFEDVFRRSKFAYQLHLRPFGSRYARWTKVFLKTPWLREFITSYLWVVLTTPR